ncbi:MAG: hypothetical protein JF617_15430 [Burkholderiales bacterium]|nr:hypothetical protein [Burkholderiales bacterium]
MRGKTQEDIGLVELLDPVAESVGYEIVRLRLMGGAEQRRLQIMAERPLLEDTRSPANTRWKSPARASTAP